MATFISHSPNDTEKLGEQIAQILSSGTVIGLTGDLGAGKTRFVQGLARGLGIRDVVLSPTFALIHIYKGGRLLLFHLDFYRLEDSRQIVAAGLTDYLEPDGIAVIEWRDRWQGNQPPGLRRFHIETLAENDRRISYDDPCP
jgi:tRNA threonylcarbamoyladenosine biosynthesis protein TsaE